MLSGVEARAEGGGQGRGVGSRGLYIWLFDALVVLSLSAASLSLTLALYDGLPRTGGGADLRNWLEAAMAIQRGDWGALVRSGRPILMPSLMALVADGPGEVDVAGLYLGWAFLALTPGALYVSCRGLLGPLPALVGGIAILGVEPAILGAGLINSQGLLNLLLAVSLGFIPWVMGRHWAVAILGGGWLALLALAKEQGLAYLALLPVMMVLPWPFIKPTPLLGRLGRAGLMLSIGLGICLGVEAWQARVAPSMAPKSTLPLRDFLSMAEGDIPPFVRQVEAETRATPGYVSRGRDGYLRRDSRLHRYLFLSAHRLRDLGQPYVPIAALGGVGFLLCLLPLKCLARSRWVALYLALCLQPLWAALLIHFNALHLSFTLPILGALLCLGPAALMAIVAPPPRTPGSAPEGKQAPLHTARLALSTLLGVALCGGLVSERQSLWGQPISALRPLVRGSLHPDAKGIGLWLSQHTDPRALVSATSGLVHLYAKRQELIIPRVPIPGPGCAPPTGLEWAPGVYFVVSAFDAAHHFPGLGLTAPEDLPGYYFDVVHVEAWGGDWTAVAKLKVKDFDAALAIAKEAGHDKAFGAFCRHVTDI